MQDQTLINDQARSCIYRNIVELCPTISSDVFVNRL